MPLLPGRPQRTEQFDQPTPTTLFFVIFVFGGCSVTAIALPETKHA
jgi:hypothetical protein